jgi:hypothetical protein
MAYYSHCMLIKAQMEPYMFTWHLSQCYILGMCQSHIDIYLVYDRSIFVIYQIYTPCNLNKFTYLFSRISCMASGPPWSHCSHSTWHAGGPSTRPKVSTLPCTPGFPLHGWRQGVKCNKVFYNTCLLILPCPVLFPAQGQLHPAGRPECLPECGTFVAPERHARSRTKQLLVLFEAL